MKTIFIMGILNFFCGISAAQPQYWGEGAYDLGNVVFGMNVDKYYSKARLYDEDYDESFRYFMKKKVKCKTQEGKKAVIQEYSSVETNYGEVLARFRHGGGQIRKTDRHSGTGKAGRSGGSGFAAICHCRKVRSPMHCHRRVFRISELWMACE